MRVAHDTPFGILFERLGYEAEIFFYYDCTNIIGVSVLALRSEVIFISRSPCIFMRAMAELIVVFGKKKKKSAQQCTGP